MIERRVPALLDIRHSLSPESLELFEAQSGGRRPARAQQFVDQDTVPTMHSASPVAPQDMVLNNRETRSLLEKTRCEILLS